MKEQKEKKKTKLEPLDVAKNGFKLNNNYEEPEVFNPNDLFGMENGSNDNNNVVKELFNEKNPKIKSELSDEEIKTISRLYVMSKKYYEPRGIYMLKAVLNEFIILRISKDRKSRQEFVTAHQELLKQKQNGFMDKVLGGLSGGGINK